MKPPKVSPLEVASDESNSALPSDSPQVQFDSAPRTTASQILCRQLAAHFPDTDDESRRMGGTLPETGSPERRVVMLVCLSRI